jgi:hypothetical protein
MVAQVRVRGIAGAAHRRDASMGKRVSPASRSPSTRPSKSSRIDQLRGDPDPVARLVCCLQHVADAQRLGHVRHRDRFSCKRRTSCARSGSLERSVMSFGRATAVKD